MAQLIDSFNRPITSLRISLTQKCNMNCFFCHQEGENNFLGEMTPQEIETIVKAASKLGIDKVKLTGGEPLLRPDIIEIVEHISPHVKEVSMTTNGVFLEEKACELRKAGLKRVNISLHTLKADGFKAITCIDDPEQVKRGIYSAIKCGLNPVKLNMVVIKGLNHDEIPSMIEFAKENGVILQLIEYQALEKGEKDFDKYHYDLRKVEYFLEKESVNVYERPLHRRHQYSLKTGGKVEVVRPMHNSEFCKHCTRLRLTSDGKLKPCLMRDDNLVDALGLIKKGAGEKALIEAFKEAVTSRTPFWRDEK